MCDFISWKEVGNKVFFLTDRDVFSPHGKMTLQSRTNNSDIFGHRAIQDFYWNSSYGYSQDFENRDFWDKSKYPSEIAQHLKSPQTLIKTWGRMLRRALQLDDAYYVLTRAPKKWRKALDKILFKVVLRDSYYSSRVLFELNDLTQKQKNALFKIVLKDAGCSYETLLNIKDLTKEQRDDLISTISRDQDFYYSYKTLLNVKRITQSQKNILIKSVLRNACDSHELLYKLKGLTKEQKKILRKASKASS